MKNLLKYFYVAALFISLNINAVTEESFTRDLNRTKENVLGPQGSLEKALGFYAVLEEMASRFWLGNFPKIEGYLDQARNPSERKAAISSLLDDSIKDILKYFKSIGGEEDLEEASTALNAFNK